MKSCSYQSHHKIKWHQILQSLEKRKNKSSISYLPGVLWGKVIDFTDEPVAQCDVPDVQNTSLDDSDNDDRE